jgi:hypothetical protein
MRVAGTTSIMSVNKTQTNSLHNPASRILAGLVALLVCAAGAATAADAERIRPYPDNPFYWQYQGKPVLLLGGDDDDNRFQWEHDKLEAQLDLLVSVEGNYVRNTMSSRDAGNEFPFARTDDRYDLGRWNETYWERFENFLARTHRRQVFVQIELFEFSAECGANCSRTRLRRLSQIGRAAAAKARVRRRGHRSRAIDRPRSR